MEVWLCGKSSQRIFRANWNSQRRNFSYTQGLLCDSFTGNRSGGDEGYANGWLE